VMWVQGQVEELLGGERARAGGLRVITTLDLDWQRQAEAIVARRLAALRPCASGADPATCDREADAARHVDNAGLIALDPQTGAVLAMVGNADYFDRSINGAVNTTLAPRQPGSAIKPLTYALALDPAGAAAAGRAPWTSATLIADLRTVFVTAEGLPYVPQNYDQVYHGPVTVRTALANSYNIPAVKTLEYVGVDALIGLANRLGIPWEQEIGGRNQEAGIRGQPELPPDLRPLTPRFGLALTLGGGEVRLLDLTAAYAAFANGGEQVAPFAISRIETLAGDALFDAKHGRAGERANGSTDDNTLPPTPPLPRSPVLDPRVAYLITDILSDDEARRPAFGIGSALDIGRPAAVKTGTTTDWRDNWTVGYTPDLVVGVWAGNADNTPMRGVSGVTGAAPIWHDFMSSVLRGTPLRGFDRPEGLVQVEVCSDSGLLPRQMGEGVNRRMGENTHSPALPPSRSTIPCPGRRLEWFISGAEPTEVDASHKQIAIDARTGQPATAATPAEYLTDETFWLLPPEFQEWAREAGIPQPTPDDGRWTKDELSSVVGPSSLVLLTSPDSNRTYRLDPGLPPTAQKLPVTVRLTPQLDALDAPVTLLVDGAPFASVHGPDYTAWWPLMRGRHTLQAAVTSPDGQSAASEPLTVFVEP
jgi:membrane carboxypeptidase/penicillin-binding protein